jgi:hypothetical protein
VLFARLAEAVQSSNCTVALSALKLLVSDTLLASFPREEVADAVARAVATSVGSWCPAVKEAAEVALEVLGRARGRDAVDDCRSEKWGLMAAAASSRCPEFTESPFICVHEIND